MSKNLVAHRLGGWLPKDTKHVRQWLDKKINYLDSVKDQAKLDPVLVALQQVIESDPLLHFLATKMFTEVPWTEKYEKDPTGKSQVRSYVHMLQLFNLLLTEGPQWYDIKHPDTAMGLIGFPFNAILDWPMNTEAGYVFFLDPRINTAFQAMLKQWGAFLSSPDSLSVLNEQNGWLSPDAQSKLATKGDDGSTAFTFPELYNCEVSAPYYGYKSWDDFFTRTFREGMRPVAAPDTGLPSPEFPDPTAVIVNACESAPLRLATDVSYKDQFWLKGQPYSLTDMLNQDSRAEQFKGGKVYQAFLSALSYHRWHSPVSGVIVDIQVVPGTYYSMNYWQGFADTKDGPDPSAPNNSQPYISHVATRGIVYIQADNKDIGLMAAIFIGMAEVSSCEFTVKPGQKVTKGDQLGMFHFGGSTHCLLFRPETTLKFLPPEPFDPNSDVNLKVLSALAIVG